MADCEFDKVLNVTAMPFAPVYSQKPNAEVFVPKWKTGEANLAEVNCLEKVQREPSLGMRWQSVEELEEEKKKNVEVAAEVDVIHSVVPGSTTVREISQMGTNEIEFTVDTGAEETVCKEEDAENFETIHGGKESETLYVMPDGRLVPNRGEKHLKVQSCEGGKFIIRTQVTSVRKPLMAVSKVCDENNIVVFRKDGGYIEHLLTGEKTHFQRVGNVYVLRLKLMDSTPAAPFQRPAQ